MALPMRSVSPEVTDRIFMVHPLNAYTGISYSNIIKCAIGLKGRPVLSPGS